MTISGTCSPPARMLTMHAHLRPITIPRGWRVATPAWVLAAFCLMMVGAWLISHWPLPWPECGRRWLTGLPCPACGGTRSLLAWTELDFTAAFLFNPLFFLLCLASLISCAWQLLRQRHGTWNITEAIRSTPFPWLPWLTWRLAGALLVLNWLYLCWRLPK